MRVPGVIPEGDDHRCSMAKQHQALLPSIFAPWILEGIFRFVSIGLSPRPPPPVSCLPPATHESMGPAAPPPIYGVEEVDVIIDIE